MGMNQTDAHDINTERRLKESVVKNSLGELNWSELRTHLRDISFTCDHLIELCGHIRRYSNLICKYPQKSYERKRNQFFKSLQNFVKTQLGNKAENDFLQEVQLIQTIENGYRGILEFLKNRCSISQHPAPVRVSASISRACYEYKEFKRRHDLALSKAKDLNMTTGVLIEGDDSNRISPDAILDSLSEAVALTLIMEAYQNNWFVDDIVILPNLPSVGDEERYQSGSTQFLALCWRQWQRVEKRRRFLDGDLLKYSDDKRPAGLPDQITTLFEYRPRENGLSECEVYDFFANTRLKDRLIQTFMEIAIETGITAHTVGITGGAALPPEQVVSTEECHACITLSELLGYSVFEDNERPGGLRLVEWVRGYVVLKEIVKGRTNTLHASPDNYAVLLTEEELIDTLKMCGLDNDMARQFVAKTCLHRASRDLFDCPLVRIKPSKYLIFGPAVINLNVSMALLSNLSSRGEVLGSKGKAFEQSIREVFRKQNMETFTFRVQRDKEEFEYDAIVPWDGYLFLFECKNRSLSGNDPAGTYYFDLEVASQAKQVRRLADALKKYPDIIEQKLGAKYLGMRIIPCIVHSLPYSRIGAIDGVYFIDSSMLKRFFEQPYLRMKVLHRIGNTNLLHRTMVRKLWHGDFPTVRDFLQQMKKPIQLELAKKHLNVKSRQFPISEKAQVLTHELVCEEMSVQSFCDAVGGDADSVLQEIAAISKEVSVLRTELDEKHRRTLN